MSINLATKYSNKIAQAHTHESFLAGKAKAPYDFVGVKSIRIYTLLSQPLNNYDRTNTTNRYGALSELQDSYQEISMTQDKSFRIAIDKGNNNEQMMVKEAGRVMKMQLREQVVPTGDKRALYQWAWGAGKCIEYSAAISKSNIISMLLDIEKEFMDAFTPLDDRYVVVKNEHVKLIKTSDEFQYVDGVRENFILKGIIGKIGTLNIIAMPAAWFPTNAEHIAFHSRAVGFPFKIRDTRIVTDSEAVNGAVLLGRFNYDAFVVGGACDDVIVVTTSGNKCADPVVAKSTNTTITSTTSSAKIYYTTDGSDPRFSASRIEYSAGITNPTAGTVIKAVAIYESGNKFTSNVTTHVCV